MNCTNCGNVNPENSRFCLNCGNAIGANAQDGNNFNNPVQNFNQPMPNQPMPNQQYPNQQMPNQQMPNQPMPNQQYPNQQMSERYINNAVNPDMNLFAILSIVFPGIGLLMLLIYYSLIGTMLMAVVGFIFSDKGKPSNAQLSQIGMIMSIVLAGLSIVIFIVLLVLGFPFRTLII